MTIIYALLVCFGTTDICQWAAGPYYTAADCQRVLQGFPKVSDKSVTYRCYHKQQPSWERVE